MNSTSAFTTETVHYPAHGDFRADPSAWSYTDDVGNELPSPNELVPAIASWRALGTSPLHNHYNNLPTSTDSPSQTSQKQAPMDVCLEPSYSNHSYRDWQYDPEMIAQSRDTLVIRDYDFLDYQHDVYSEVGTSIAGTYF